MIQRPFFPPFSMPEKSVKERIAEVKSKVDPAMTKGMTDVERMLVEKLDMALQHGEILAQAADEQNATLESVDQQTKRTNGRVNDHDGRIKAAEDILKSYRESAAKRTRYLLIFIPILVPIVDRLIGLFLHK